MKSKPPGEQPLCAMCGKPLKPFILREQDWAKEKGRVWGYSGHNVFCSMTCGYQLGLWYIREKRKKGNDTST